MVSLGRLLGHRETKSIGERKLALFIQTNLLKRELDNLKRQDYRESQLRTYTGRKAYVGLIDLVESFDNKGK